MRVPRVAALAAVLLLVMSTARSSTAESPANPETRQAFAAAAFRAEYDKENTDALRRWAQPLVVFIEEDRTDQDQATLSAFFEQLNHRLVNFPGVSLTESQEQANVTVRFAPLDMLGELDSIYVEGNWGFFSFWYNDFGEITNAQVLIANDVTSQRERNHLLLEEFTGLLGLPNDIDSPDDSILYQPWTTTQDLSTLDWQLLNLLYDSRLHPGMTWAQAKAALMWE